MSPDLVFKLMFLVPAALPLLAPNLKALGVLAALVGSAILWVNHQVDLELNAPGRRGSAGDFMTAAFIALAWFGLGIGVALRLVLPDILRAILRR